MENYPDFENFAHIIQCGLLGFIFSLVAVSVA